MRTVSTFSPAAISRWKRLLQILSRPSPSSRTLAQVRSEPFSELWFTAAAPARVSAKTTSADGLLYLDGQIQGNGVPGGDHKPPDERTVKLGQSMKFRIVRDIANVRSSTHTITSPTEHSHHSIAARNHITQCIPTSLSFNPSPSTCCKRQDTIQGCFVDSARSVGMCAGGGKR